jgi:hypothetical protein
MNKMQPIMKTAMINEELTRLRLSPPFATGLGEKIADRRSERAGEDECRREQQGAGKPRVEVGDRHKRQGTGEGHGRTFVSQPRIIGKEIAEAVPSVLEKSIVIQLNSSALRDVYC